MEYYEQPRQPEAFQEAFHDYSDEDDDDWADDFTDSDEEDQRGEGYAQKFAQLPPEPEEDIYDHPEESAPPQIVRSLKPAVNRPAPAPSAKPAVSNKPKIAGKVNIIHQASDFNQKQSSVADRRAMFDPQSNIHKKVPSPFRNDSALFPPFGSQANAGFTTQNNFHRGDGNNNRHRNNITSHIPPQPTIDLTYEIEEEITQQETYQVPDESEEYYIDPQAEDPHAQSVKSQNSKNDMSKRSLPPVPPSKPDQPIPVSELLNRINTLKLKGNHKSAPIEVPTEETYEICDQQVVETVHSKSRLRIDSNSSQQSNASVKSTGSWNSSASPVSSRENSFRKNKPIPANKLSNSLEHQSFPQPHHHKQTPLPPVPFQENQEQENYEVVEQHATTQRPPISQPAQSHRAAMPLPLSPGTRCTPGKLPSPRRATPMDEEDSYDYADDHITSFPLPHHNKQGISIPDEDDYEIPDGQVVKDCRSELAAVGRPDIPPSIPERVDDPMRLTPPVRPPKGQKTAQEFPKMSAEQPMIEQLRNQKPRHSCDVGMDTRKRLELNILRNGWLTGLHISEEKYENVEHMRRKLLHQLQLPGGRPETDSHATTNSSAKRPVPVPPVGRKPQLPPPGPKPLFDAPPAPPPKLSHTSPGPKPPPQIPVGPKPVAGRGFPVLPFDLVSAVAKRNPASETSSMGNNLQKTTPVAPNSWQTSRSNTNSLSNNSWYHGNITRQASEQILRGKNQQGGFIIRDTDKGEGYSISIYYQGAINHLRVPLQDGKFRLGTSAQNFSSVEELVRHYLQTQIELKSGGKCYLAS